MRRPDPTLALVVPAALLVGVGFAAPLAWLGRLSLYESAGSGGYGIGLAAFYVPGTLTLDNYRTVLADPYLRDVGRFTLGLGLVSAVVSVALAYPFALVVAGSRGLAQGVLLGATILPKFVNPLVVIAGVEAMLAGTGLARSFAAVVLGEVIFVFPYAALILVATFASVSRRLVLAARGLGAGPVRAFLAVTLPLTWRGTRAAFLLCLLFGLSAFTAPFFLGGPEHYTLSIVVHRQILVNLDWAAGAATAVEMLALAVLLVLASSRLLGSPRSAPERA